MKKSTTKKIEEYTDLAVEKTVELLAIDSPTCFTDMAADWVTAEFSALGYAPVRTNKGGVTVDLGGEDASDALLVEGHIDTIGCMVDLIKSDGRLRVTKLGGVHPENLETENVRVYTRSGRILEGTFQLCNPSVHVNGDFSDTKRTFDTTEVVLDEDVRSEEDARALGVEVGDIVCFETRTRITSSGYIKSRYLDDKLAVGILLAFAKYLKDSGAKLRRRVYLHITVYEEVGHGGSGYIPEGITEGLAIDMGCVGDKIYGSEKKVSICAKDAAGPYSHAMTGKLIDAAVRSGADYAVDVYPHYGSDVETTLRAGADIRHGLIGPGVYASHGYERSHKDGVTNTLKLLAAYLDV